MKLPRYVSEFDDNRGKRRYRFRCKGKAVYLPGPPYSDAFNLAYADALAGATSKPGGAGRKPKSGTVSALVVDYYGSARWQSLKPSTQASQRRILENFREAHGDKPFALMEPHHIKRELAKMAATPAQGNRWLQLLRQLFDFAIDDGAIDRNPARLVKKIPTRETGGHTPWPETEIEKFEARWPTGTKERLAFDLFLHTGQRIGDVATMMRTHVRDGAIRVVQEKTGTELWLPIHPQLQASLAAVPSKGLALLQRQSGQPYTKGGLDNWFRRKREAADIAPGLSPHGLRKSAGIRLADAGATAHQIMAVLGHKSLREAQRYTQGSDQRRNAQAAFSKLAGTSKERNLSSTPDSVSSTGVKAFK